MADKIVFETEAAELLKTALRQFAEWAAKHWTITQSEAECLSTPTEAPAVYTRGYNEAIRSIPDAADLWMSEGQYE